MKKYYLSLFIIGFVILIFNSCSDDDVNPITTDISVTSSESLIFWVEENDLTQKINNALTYNYGNATENEIEKNLVFNSDTTQVVVSINFKQEYQNKYYDSNIANNSTIITLQKESEISICNIDILGLTAGQMCEMLNTLDFELSNFNLNSQGFICVPITFQKPQSINISQSTIQTIITNLNSNFFDSKILFQLNTINNISDNGYYNLNVSQANFQNDIPNTLNVYICHTLQDNGSNYNGLAHFPNENIDRVYVRDDFFNLNRDPKSAVLTHEIGHFFSLLHTFQENIPSYCITDHDHIDSTPIDEFGITTTNADNYYGQTCNAINSNIEQLIKNFMSYSINVYALKDCNRSFTQEQHKRIGFSARQWKQHLNCQNNSGQSTISLSGNINFGNTQINTSSAPQTLTISNTGTTSFNVSGITSSSSVFTILNGQSATIQPQGSINVLVQFNPTQVQTYNGTIIVQNDADNGNGYITVTGTGVNNSSGSSNISLSGNLNFGNVNVGSSSSQTFTINNTGNQSFYVSGINFPHSVYSANWTSGTINAGGSQNVTVTFQPTAQQSYNGNVTVNNNANSGNNTISISGSGTNTSTGNSDLIVEEIWFEEENNGNWEIHTKIKNIGNVATPNNEDIYIRYYVNGTEVDDDYANPLNVNATATEYVNNYQFPYNGTHTVKVVIDPVSNESNTSNNSLTTSFNNSSSNNAIPITPSNNCATAPIMQVNTEYIVNINVADYGLASPIDGESYNGQNIRGFWLAIQVPSGYYATDINIYDVSNNFNPVIGLKSNCSYDYYPNTNNPYVNFANDNGLGGSENFGTGLPGSGSGNDGIYHIRIYHYNGSQTPNISFKIKIE